MKKFMKFCLIIAAIFVVIGLVLGITGSALTGADSVSDLVNKVTEGRVQFNMNPENWGLQIDNIFDDLGGVEFGGVNYEIEDSVSFNPIHVTLSGDVDKYLLEGTIKNLEIEAGGCSFRVETSGDEHFYAEARNAGKYQAYVENETLYVKTTATGVKTWDELSGSKITLYVPEGFAFEDVDVNLGAGVLNFVCLQAAEASLEVGAGQIIADSALVQALEVNVGAGQVKLKDMEITELKAEVGMGEFTAAGKVLGNVDAECSMGNLELQLAGKESDFNYELNGAMGNLNLNGENYSGFAQERDIDNGADKDIKIECSMGNVSVKFND